MWLSALAGGAVAAFTGWIAGAAAAASSAVELIKRSFQGYYGRNDHSDQDPYSPSSPQYSPASPRAREFDPPGHRQRPTIYGHARNSRRRDLEENATERNSIISELEKAGEAFTRFTEHLLSVISGLASTISDANVGERSLASPSDEPPVGLNATDKNRVRQIKPLEAASAAPFPERPESPVSDKTANERIQELMKTMERERLEEAVRKAMESSTLPMSTETKDTVPKGSLDPSVRTLPSPVASVVDSASPATPHTNASLPSSLIQSGPPFVGPPLPGALNQHDVARSPGANDTDSKDADVPASDDIAEVADDGASPPDGGDAKSATGDDSGNDSGSESAGPDETGPNANRD